MARQVAEENGLPAVSYAIVDRDAVVCDDGGDAVHRVGSISKLFTAAAIMRQVEKGAIDIDVPVSTYLPDFHPENPYDKPITLRQMMSHRSGLVREPPIGSYFDAAPPSISEIAASLNDTKVVLEPESKTKYSNAAIVTVGRALESVVGQPYADHMQAEILAPLGMTSSSFERPPKVAESLMWSYDGREFPSPTFDVLVPAGNLYSTAGDLSRFLIALFEPGRLLKPETLQQMYEPQFGEGSFGIGFALSKFEGRLQIGHGGAVYGFSSQITALPDERIGAVALSARDVSNTCSREIANYALRLMLAHRAGEALPPWKPSEPVPAEVAARLAGAYEDDQGRRAEIIRRPETLDIEWNSVREHLRQLDGDVITDGRLSYGVKVESTPDGIRIDGRDLKRLPNELPPAAPQHLRPLLGEYGWDHNVLFVFEEAGHLKVLVEWAFFYPLTESQPGTFNFPNSGLYHDESIVFQRDPAGKITAAILAGIRFPRRNTFDADGQTFRITPLRPVAELTAEALESTPPASIDAASGAELVPLAALDPTIQFDIRYATSNNFLGTPVYSEAKAFLRQPAAEALLRAHQSLRRDGLGLLIHDAYRPWYVTKVFFEATPPEMRGFVADPSKGSIHNRGAAVDLSLYDLKTKQPIKMVSGYDEFTARAFPDYYGGSARERFYREKLRLAMETEGFQVYPVEWWHFNFRDAENHAILNKTFQELAQ